MRVTGKTKRPAWVEGAVDRRRDHVSISYGEGRNIVALVAPHPTQGFRVQFLLKPRQTSVQISRILDEVQSELTFYLLSIVGPDSWTFVQYHCDTLANRRSMVHWSWHPKSPQTST